MKKNLSIVRVKQIIFNKNWLKRHPFADKFDVKKMSGSENSDYDLDSYDDDVDIYDDESSNDQSDEPMDDRYLEEAQAMAQAAGQEALENAAARLQEEPVQVTEAQGTGIGFRGHKRDLSSVSISGPIPQIPRLMQPSTSAQQSTSSQEPTPEFSGYFHGQKRALSSASLTGPMYQTPRRSLSPTIAKPPTIVQHPQVTSSQEQMKEFSDYLHSPETPLPGDREWGVDHTEGPPATMGQLEWTNTIDEDLAVLRRSGFNIDNTVRLGTGTHGMVYRGTYATAFPAANDRQVNITAGEPFAVKIIDHTIPIEHMNDPNARRLIFQTGEYDEEREQTEAEKFIVTNINHPNVITVKYIINMGEQKIYSFEDSPTNSYICSDRVYIFMELSPIGCLEDWLKDNNTTMSAYQRIGLIRDIFNGMKYLHENGITQGSPHSRNILLFNGDDRLIAKWTDFGRGTIKDNSTLKQYLFKSYPSENEWDDDARTDMIYMAEIIQEILNGRGQGSIETQEEEYILNEMVKMCRMIRLVQSTNLNEVFEQYKDVLEE